MVPFTAISSTKDEVAETIADAKPKRIQAIDALRGCSLFGIILTHVCLVYLDLHQIAGSKAVLDSFAYKVVYQLLIGKASTVFSFLFGLSFSMQMQSARSKAESFTLRFAWRLVILLFIGYLNNLLFKGDILQTYAIMGFVLIGFANLRNRTIVVAGALLCAFGVVVRYYSQELQTLLSPFTAASKNSEWLSFWGFHRLEFFLGSGRLFTIPSLFLFGMYAGRKNMFIKALKSSSVRKSMLLWGIIASVVTTCAFYLMKDYFTLEVRNYFAINIFRNFALAFLYIAALLWLYSHGLFRRVLDWLAPVGQMGLSTYIMQSVLLYQLNVVASRNLDVIGFHFALMIAAVFFVFQVLFANFWMYRFRFGPVEWLWRTLMHFKLQPIRR